MQTSRGGSECCVSLQRSAGARVVLADGCCMGHRICKPLHDICSDCIPYNSSLGYKGKVGYVTSPRSRCCMLHLYNPCHVQQLSRMSLLIELARPATLRLMSQHIAAATWTYLAWNILNVPCQDLDCTEVQHELWCKDCCSMHPAYTGEHAKG